MYRINVNSDQVSSVDGKDFRLLVRERHLLVFLSTILLLSTEKEGERMLSIRENPWSSGGQWISRGFKAFRQDFGAWLVFIVCHIGGLIVVSFIPFVGSIATGVAPSIVNGLGMRLMHDRLKSDIPMSFGAIQPELNKTGTELLGLGAINWGLNFVAVMPMLIFGFFGVIFAGLGGVLLEQISGDLTSMPMPVDETAFVSMMLIFF